MSVLLGIDSRYYTFDFLLLAYCSLWLDAHRLLLILVAQELLDIAAALVAIGQASTTLHTAVIIIHPLSRTALSSAGKRSIPLRMQVVRSTTSHKVARVSMLTGSKASQSSRPAAQRSAPAAKCHVPLNQAISKSLSRLHLALLSLLHLSPHSL